MEEITWWSWWLDEKDLGDVKSSLSDNLQKSIHEEDLIKRKEGVEKFRIFADDFEKIILGAGFHITENGKSLDKEMIEMFVTPRRMIMSIKALSLQERPAVAWIFTKRSQVN